MAFKTEAIVLHHRPLRAADRLYYLLTPQEGRLKVILRSASKTSSKLAGHLEPFQRVRIMIGRGMHDHVAGVDIIESWAQIRLNPSLYALASSLAETLLLLSPPGIDSRTEYSLAREAFSQLNRTDLTIENKEQTVYHTLWRLLALGGWKFDFSHCQMCGTVSNEWWYAPGRGFTCESHKERHSISASPFIEFFHQAQGGQSQVALPDATVGDLREITQIFFQEATGRNLKSLVTYYQL